MPKEKRREGKHAERSRDRGIKKKKMTAKEKVEETNKKQVKNFIKNSGKSKREERLRQRK